MKLHQREFAPKAVWAINTGNMNKQQKHVLLVDDEELASLPIQLFLERDGYMVQNARNGYEALETLQTSTPDLVITDLQMPGMDGFSLIEHLIEQKPQCPIIVISGMNDTGNLLKALMAGAWDYIQKPIADPKLLQHCVNKVFERYDHLQLSLKYQKLLAEFKEGNAGSKLTERELKEQILKAKREWEGTVNLLTDPIALFDDHHCIIRLNEAMAQKFGLHTADALERRLCFFEQCIDKKINDTNCPQVQVLATGKEYREQLTDKDGIIYEVLVRPFYSKDKYTPTGTVLHARDVTERVHIRDKQEQLHRQLMEAQKLESVGRLAAGIAHELNTPIQYLATNIDFLHESFSDICNCISSLKTATSVNRNELFTTIDWSYLEQEIPITLQQCFDGINKISSIVHAMKEFSHPGSKKMERADINHLIETIVTVARNEWKYIAEVQLHLTPNLPAAPCLANEIGQAILNILINAIHAIEKKNQQNPGKNNGIIQISTQEETNKDLTISIQDNGTGIPQEIQNKIFEPFFTTKKIGEGTGQGLAIAYDIITHKHMGKIQVSSLPGEGTTFTITLPYRSS